MSTKQTHLSSRREFRTSILVLLAGGLTAASCGFDETGSVDPPKPVGSTSSSASSSSSSGDAVGGGGGNGAGGAGGAAGMGGVGGNAPCNPGLTDCQGVCVDTTSDENHCGKCETVCDPGWTCEASECKAPPVCTPGSTMPCYTGPTGTEGQGVCVSGTQTCLPDGSGYDAQCNGEVVPSMEVCGNDVDENCNGLASKSEECLASNGLVVRYFLDEAANGKGPMTALDSAADPLDLGIDYSDDDNMRYVEISTGRGLRWDVRTSSGTASAPIDATKVLSAISGKTTYTFELVTEIDDVSPDSSRLFYIGSGTDPGYVTVSSNATNRIQLRWQNNWTTPGNWAVNLPMINRCVLHVVLDTTQATSTQRARLYVNGNLVTNNMGNDTPAQNQTVMIPAGKSLYLGNRDGGIRSIAGSLYYAALYDRALSDAEITNNAQVLLAHDDQ